MADKTESRETVTREEFADYLRELADEFAAGGEATIRVGNKSVALTPPDQMELEVEVIERSSVLQGNKEALDIEVNWSGGR